MGYQGRFQPVYVIPPPPPILLPKTGKKYLYAYKKGMKNKILLQRLL